LEINYSIGLIFLFLGSLEFPLHAAEPGKIVRLMRLKRITPPGYSPSTTQNFSYFDKVEQIIGGENVDIFNLHFGLVIREDDFDDLTTLFVHEFRSKSRKGLTVLPVNVLRLGIRALWPGQSYGSLIRLGTNGRPAEKIPYVHLAPFHKHRLAILGGTLQYFEIIIYIFQICDFNFGNFNLNFENWANKVYFPSRYFAKTVYSVFNSFNYPKFLFSLII
jgi:hypothetical protein